MYENFVPKNRDAEHEHKHEQERGRRKKALNMPCNTNVGKLEQRNCRKAKQKSNVKTHTRRTTHSCKKKLMQKEIATMGNQVFRFAIVEFQLFFPPSICSVYLLLSHPYKYTFMVCQYHIEYAVVVS